MSLSISASKSRFKLFWLVPSSAAKYSFDYVPPGDKTRWVKHLDGRKVAIERNLEIVPRSAYGKTVLADGDRIEIVHFIGGG